MIITNSDGGSRGNPGPGAIGVLVRDNEKILIKYQEGIGNFVTNNIAEYEALIKVLELALKTGAKEIECCLDSELVVKQLLDAYQVKDKKLLELFLEIQKLQEKFEKVKYKYVSRWDKFQQITDEMLNEELDKITGKKKKFFIKRK